MALSGANSRRGLDRHRLQQESRATPALRLEDRVIAITGASRGIGLAIAQACAAQGARLALIARERKALQRAAASITDARMFACDVSARADVQRLFQTLRRNYGRLDVLVNNAGVFTYKPFVRTTLDDWDKNIRINLTALYLVTRAALPLLRRASAPHIVNILSISSRTAFPNCSAYSASKFGALGFTRVLGEELRPLGIRVTAILPGPTNTGMISEFDFPVDRQSLLQPEDVADAVLAALLLPSRGTINEVLLTPSQGTLGSRAAARALQVKVSDNQGAHPDSSGRGS